MHHKEIKNQVRKQLKSRFPNWKSLSKKEKRKVSRSVLEQVSGNHDFSKEVETPTHELLGLEEQVVSPHIMNLEQMDHFIKNHYDSQLFNCFKLNNSSSYIKDEELKLIDEMLDNEIIDKILSYEGYSPSMRDFAPHMFFRAELLKSLKHPEISYRKFCGDDQDNENHKRNNSFTGENQLQNRAFIGLEVNRKDQFLSHVQLCQFRSSLTFDQMVNLTVYILHQFNQCGFLNEQTVHCVDSTELAVENQTLLASLKIKGQNIRIYDDIDCDCGVRRKKRDKSVYVIGYRLHTLTAIDAKTGQSYPLISLLAPANHHDSNFLLPLTQLGKAIGLDVKLITADEAYEDKDGSLLDETGTHLVKPVNSEVNLPPNVEKDFLQVTLDDLCEIPMEYTGADVNYHEFRCSAASGECIREGICPKIRQIEFDNGHFQRIIHNNNSLVQDALDIRKNGERPFNLLKKREGLEGFRTRTQHSLLARSTFATIATLLLEIAGTRKKKKKEKHKQLTLQLAA